MKRALLILALIAAAGSRPAAFAQDGPCRVERIAADHWRVTVENIPPGARGATEHERFSRIIMPGYVPRLDPGLPGYPFTRFAFGVPAGGALRVELRSFREEAAALSLTPFAPDAPRAAVSGKRALNGAAGDFLSFGEPRLNRGVPEQSVEFRPVLWDGSDRVRWVRSMVFDVRITGITSAAAAAPAVATRTALEGVLNGPDAASFRSAPKTPRAKESWFTPGETMLKIRIRESGVYRLGRAELEQAGVPLSSIDPREFRLFVAGYEHPLLVRGEADGRFDPDDEILFYAERLSSPQFGWFDFWDRDRALFLRWGGVPGRRYQPHDASPPAEPPVSPLLERLHIEEDHAFHFGDHDASDGNTTDYLPGKTWMWRYLFKKDTLRIPIAVRNPASGEGRLRVRLKHSSRDPVRARIVLNGAVLAEYDIRDYEISERTMTVPAAVLRGNADTLLVINAQIVECPPQNPTCTIERMYFDWADLDYPSIPTARGGIAIVEPVLDSIIIPGPRVRIEAGGFTSAAITGLSPLQGLLLEGFETSGSAPDLRVAAGVVLADGANVFFTSEGARAPDALTLVTPPDLASQTADAEYIVVTHGSLRAEAERIAAYRRQTDAFTTAVADVDDIYDVFNFGQKHPKAIRACLEAAYTASGGSKPRFVLLLGDASWDARNLLENATRADLVPAWGNPVSDNYYVSFDSSGRDITPLIAIGRIPAQTLEEATAVIDKVLEYEGIGPQEWDNRFLFSVGGKSQLEQDFYLKPPVSSIVAKWMQPYCLDPRVMIKTRPDLPVSYNDLDTLVSEANRGVNWFYFIGHGGTRIIDVGVERPDIFALKGKYPFFLTMSCNTAHFAEPYETGLNERFILAKDNGAIMTYGTSGLGEIGHDNVLSDGLFDGMLKNGLRTYGDLSLHAKLKLVQYFGLSDDIARSTIEQYALFGDPATKLPLSLGIDLAVDARELRVTPTVLAQLEPARIVAVIRNTGRCLKDSVDVRVTVTSGNVVVFEQTQRVPPFLLSDTVEWSYDFRDASGPVTIDVSADPYRLLVEAVVSNNSARMERVVLPHSVRAIFPQENENLFLRNDSARFVVANPSRVPPLSASPVIELQIARNAHFTDLLATLRRDAEPVFTHFDAVLPAGSAGRTLYWRSRLVSDTGAQQWSSRRAFGIDKAAPGPDPLTVWRQNDSAGFSDNDRVSVDVVPGGTVVLGSRPLQLTAFSAGANQVEIITAVLRVDGTDYSVNRRGFNVAVVDPAAGTVSDTLVFDTYWDRANADAMERFLDAIPADRWLLVAVKDDANGWPPVSPGGSNITQGLKRALKSFGARLIDSVGFQHSYAFIGSRSDTAAARELWVPYGSASAERAVTVPANIGAMTSPRVGPAARWLQYQHTGAIPQDGSIGLRIFASGATGDTLLAEHASLASAQTLDLSDIDAALHPQLRFQAVLTRAAASPAFASWEVRCESRFPELGITSQVVVPESTELEEGDPFVVRVDVYNAGNRDADSVEVTLAFPGETGRRATVLLPRVPAGRGTHAATTLQLPTTGQRGDIGYDVAVDPAARFTEYYRGNNTYADGFQSAKDAARPELEVLFDDVQIADNDYVSPTPRIAIKLRDASPLPITDTSSMQVFLDGTRIWLNANPRLTYDFPAAGAEKARILFTPDLTPAGTGARLHTLAVSGRDASGNQVDSIPYQVRFYVTRDNRVDNVYPYPNPTTGALDFTYRVTGSEAPSAATVKIYTVAGRLIRELSPGLELPHIGFNRIPWDGRDGDGAELANGTYFYKLVLRYDNRDSENIGKFSVLR